MEIWLYLNANGITQQQWKKAWDECLEALHCFPVPLSVLDGDKKWKHERNVWKTQLVQGKGVNKSLCIQSDMASLEFGGRFRLYHSISHYQESEENKDVLWISEDEIDEYSHRYRIWENGTNGAPYSLAVLALGILLENRFPAQCYMFGFDYSDEHVSNMSSWLSGALNRNIMAPLCNDPRRLWERLIPLFSSIDLAVSRFCKLVKTSKRTCFEFLIAQGYGDALQNELIRQMSHFSSVAQWGVTDWLFPYLEATKDVEQVAILVKRVHEKTGAKDFTLKELLVTLLDKGVTINPMQAEVTKLWNDTGDKLVTKMEGFNRLFLRMGGLPDRIDFYISSDELLEIFGCMEPANGSEFQKIIKKETSKCLKSYQKMQETTDEIAGKLSDEAKLEKEYATEIMARWLKRRYLPCEDYIIREIEGQIATFPDSEKNSLTIARQLSKVLKNYEKEYKEPFLQTKTREYALEKIALFSKEFGFTLRETAWEVIDREQDLDTLTMLTVYAALDQNEKTFWDWRKHIFETPALWPAMHEEFLRQ